MEEDQELGFLCRFCSKRFPCGKSLGGHIRSHITGNSSESDEKLEPINVAKVSSQNCEDSRYSGYCLRGNPKKTWRFVNSKAAAPQKEQVCKQCGKGFQSVKALCGHMACHSEKERILKDDYDYDHSWTSENHKLVMDSQSDTEAENPRRRQRWRRQRAAASMRYKRALVNKSSLGNGSSSVSEIDNEQEEVAMWLMMLSRDSGNWAGVNSVAESSDNNSVVLETKSSSIEMRIGRERSSFDCVYDGAAGTVGNKNLGKGKFKSRGLDAETVHSGNSDSGYFMDEPKKVDSGVSVAGFSITDKFKKKKKKVNCESRFEVSDPADMEKDFSTPKCMGARLKKHFYMEKSHDGSVIASNSTKNDSKKRTANSFFGPDFSGKSCKKLLQGHSEGNEQESGRRKKENVESLSSNGENRFKPARNRKHECPICHKIYKSGQALGGHKRSHYLGGSGEKFNQNPVIKQELVSDLLDLNLPAPVEEDSNGNSQFHPW